MKTQIVLTAFKLWLQDVKNNKRLHYIKFILNTYIQSIVGDLQNCYTIPFKFQIAISLKTSHYIIFIIREEQRAKKLFDLLHNFVNYKDDILCYSTKNDTADASAKLF